MDIYHILTFGFAKHMRKTTPFYILKYYKKKKEKKGEKIRKLTNSIT